MQGRGGDASSGFAEVSAVGGGSLILNGDLEMSRPWRRAATESRGHCQRAIPAHPTDFLPNAIVYAQNGAITVSGLTSLNSNSYGGAGFAGGNGGEARAGSAVVNSDNSLAGSSSISLQDLTISASSYGGDGGTGASGAAGGAGGAATGGEVDAFAGAGNGSLTVAGQTILSATALGGDGGEGGGGTVAGAGGTGGAATGGTVIFGTLSRGDTGAVNTGAASFAGVLAFAEGSGGTGGVGGAGSSAQGNGGAGGAATGGAAILVVRGSPVTITGSVSLGADAIGGDGGSGALQGAGGAATVGGDGGVGISMTARAQQPAQRGFLDAADIFGSAQAIGGNGSILGAASVADSPISISIADSDATIGSLALFASGDPIVGVRPSFISIAGGTVNIAGALAMSTPGEMSVALDNSTVNVGELSLSAGNYVLPAVRPATLGTFNVLGAVDLNSGLDFLAYANFVLPGGGTFDADGSVLTGDISANGTLDISAAGSITTGALNAANVILQASQGVTTLGVDAAGRIYITAGGPISLGNLTSGGTTLGLGKIAIGSASGVTAGSMRSTGDLGVQTSGSIVTGDLIGRDILLLAGGDLSTGSLLAASGTQSIGGDILRQLFDGGQHRQRVPGFPYLCRIAADLPGNPDRDRRICDLWRFHPDWLIDRRGPRRTERAVDRRGELHPAGERRARHGRRRLAFARHRAGFGRHRDYGQRVAGRLVGRRFD